LAYGIEIQQRVPELIKAILDTIGDQAAGDPVDTDDSNKA